MACRADSSPDLSSSTQKISAQFLKSVEISAPGDCSTRGVDSTHAIAHRQMRDHADQVMQGVTRQRVGLLASQLSSHQVGLGGIECLLL